MEPPEGIPPRKKRMPLASSTPTSSPSKPDANASLLNASQMGMIGSEKVKKAQDRLKSKFLATEKSCVDVLEKFTKPSLLPPLFPSPEAENGQDVTFPDFIRRYSHIACLAVVGNLRENAEKVLQTQQDYLHALDSLLVAGSSPENVHGLNRAFLQQTYRALIRVSKLEYEMSIRVKVLSAMIGQLDQMEDPNQQMTVVLDQLYEPTQAQGSFGVPDVNIFIAAEDLGSFCTAKFDEAIAAGSANDTAHRIKRWRRIMGKRGIKCWDDDEFGDGTTDGEESDVDDNIPGLSMNSVGDTQTSMDI
ncbi:hypothetical protein BV898_07248 [Hypsibius exemplaris]|uniref:Uncharacterized protein n=1 Tax=Hypsibius exemplaris TaxID=2072580 RepID=A0A1W0WTS6_HYPEX|nr:hypothetical protein BV898_07248 [Hypsibius exemplaris]